MQIAGELAFNFSSYWSVVSHHRPQKPDLKLPLSHMRSDGFGQPLDEQMQVLKYRDLPAYIRFDAEFLGTVNDPTFRAQARSILIRTWFEPDEQAPSARCWAERPRPTARRPPNPPPTRKRSSAAGIFHLPAGRSML